MFDLNLYSSGLLSFLFFAYFLVILFLFKMKLTSVFDPLFYHCIWLGSVFSFLTVYVIDRGISYVAVMFFVSLIFYMVSLVIFLPGVDKFKSAQIPVFIFLKRHLLLLWLVFLYSKAHMLQYFYENLSSPELWFLYRFVDLQGRDALSRIIGISVQPILMFVCYTNIFILKRHRKLSYISLILLALMGVLGGGRSSIIVMLLAAGGFFCLYYSLVSSALKRYSLAMYISGAAALAVLIWVGMYIKGAEINPFFIVLERFFANADGIEYALKFDAIQRLDTGVEAYILSIFGVYLKSPLGLEYKNIGWQLSEMAYGYDLSFAQGANYTLPLQVLVAGPYLFPFVMVLSAFIVVFLRRLVLFKITKDLLFVLLCYQLLLSGFTFVVDAEFAVLKYISICSFTVFIWSLFWLMGGEHVKCVYGNV